DGHADLLGDTKRPLAGALEVSQSGRAIPFASRLFRVGHGADRLVLLACPRGLAFHRVTQAPQFLRELWQRNATLYLLEGVVVRVSTGADCSGLPGDIVGVSARGSALDGRWSGDLADIDFCLLTRPFKQYRQNIPDHVSIAALELQPQPFLMLQTLLEG